MEGSTQVGGVTPNGIREGDRDALQALIDRRGPAVMAFCTRVCGSSAAPRAAAEAFARFRAAVRDALDLSAVDPEALLRGATRHAAAAMARTPSGPPPHGRLRSRGTQTCQHVPTMLAARANGALGEADLERLARHLDRCERCGALGEIFRSAEAAYAEPAIDTLGSETATLLIDAMLAVPEQAIGFAPAPQPGAPASQAQEGAFGHLPDLDDEVPIEDAAAAPAAEAFAAEVPEADAPPTEQPEADADAAADLPLERVEDPAAELDHESLAAEPLPEHPPAESEQQVDLGETVEWDVGPVALARRSYAEAAAPAISSGRTRRGHGRFGAGLLLKVVLPVVLVAAFAVFALAAAGVLGGGDEPAPVVQRSVAPHLPKPVLTPLPVTTATSSTTASATASSATPAATATTAAGSNPAATATTTTTAATSSTTP